jgi:hypothetical protein
MGFLMAKFALGAASALSCVSLCNVSHADCLRRFSTIFFQGDTHVTEQLVTNGSPCRHDFSSGPNVPVLFEAASIAARPRHGTLQQAGELRFVYKPADNYKGSDEYSLKVCGQGNGNKGCSIVTFRTTIE